MSTDQDELPLPPHGKPPAAFEDAKTRRMPCRWCGESTLVSMLNHHGARCLSCYEAFLREPQPSPDCGDRRVDGPIAWAHALKRRDEAGDRLTQAQRDAWRTALRWVQVEASMREDAA